MLNIYYNPEHDIHIREYYNYVASLFKDLDYSFNIILGKYITKFDNLNPVLKIDIQCEHTLVKKGGRGTDGAIEGKIPMDNDFYLIRIGNLDYYRKIDGIIEYSLPNINNIKSVDNFQDILDKIIYIAPTLYDNVFYEKKERVINCITMFSSIYEPRRYKLLVDLQSNGILSSNITNVFKKEELKNIYLQTKVILNIHQTDHHDTFEELRVLPAIMNGIIVISENVPLREKIPYNEYIIWCDYMDIISTYNEVINNYEFYWNKIYSDGKLENIICNLKKDNIVNIQNFLNRIN